MFTANTQGGAEPSGELALASARQTCYVSVIGPRTQ